MTVRSLKNDSLRDYQSFLKLAKCKQIGSKRGHLHYTRADLKRPITVQSHVSPVPEFIIRNNNRTIGYSKEEFCQILDGEVEVVRTGDLFTLLTVEKKHK